MFAVSKNHVTKLLELHKTNEYYLMHDNDSTYEKWEPPEGGVTPEIVEAHFGIANGQCMTLHTIYAISDDEEELRARKDDRSHPQRIQNKKRHSIDNGTIPLSKLKVYDSLKTSTKNDTKRAVRKAGKSSKWENANNVGKGNSAGNKPVDPANQITADTIDKVDSVNGSGEGDGSGGGKTEDYEEMYCDGNCQMTEFFKNELNVAQETIKELQGQVKSMQESNRRTVEDFTKQLSELNKNLKPKGTKKKKRSAEHKKNFLANIAEDGWNGACMLDGSEVPAGKIHFGDNIFVDAMSISSEVEAKSFDLRKRVKALLPLIYPNDILKRALDVSKVETFSDPVAISPTTVTIIVETLDHMGWDKDADLSRSKVSESIRKNLGYMRDTAKTKSLPADKQVELKKAKAEKVKAKRAADKEKGVQKPRKSQKKGDNDSSEEEEEEEEEESAEGPPKKKKKANQLDSDSEESDESDK